MSVGTGAHHTKWKRALEQEVELAELPENEELEQELGARDEELGQQFELGRKNWSKSVNWGRPEKSAMSGSINLSRRRGRGGEQEELE